MAPGHGTTREVRRRRMWDHRESAGNPEGDSGTPGTEDGTETRNVAPVPRKQLGRAAGGGQETSETPVGDPRGGDSGSPGSQSPSHGNERRRTLRTTSSELNLRFRSSRGPDSSPGGLQRGVVREFRSSWSSWSSGFPMGSGVPSSSVRREVVCSEESCGSSGFRSSQQFRSSRGPAPAAAGSWLLAAAGPSSRVLLGGLLSATGGLSQLFSWHRYHDPCLGAIFGAR